MAELKFDVEKCILCGQCVSQCPFGALELKNDRIEVNASCKMCRLCVKSCPVGAVSLAEERRELVDKEAWRGILVFAELNGQKIHPVAFELIGKARELAAKVDYPVYVLLIGDGDLSGQAKELQERGVDRIFVYSDPEYRHYRSDVYTRVAADCISRVKPSVVLVGATPLGRSLAPACATRFGTGLTADCTMLDIRENTDLVQIRPAFGGNIMAQIITTATRPQFATVRFRVMDAAPKAEPRGEILYWQAEGEPVSSGMEVQRADTMEKIKGIEEEDVLVVAGRGVKKEEDLSMLRRLAEALGGQLATTRPLVEKGWNDVTRQVGLSGRTVKPRLIITCGVSGAVQFTAGMDGAECIVAINTDREAPIFKIANYCIAEDLYQVVPELIERLKDGGKESR